MLARLLTLVSLCLLFVVSFSLDGESEGVRGPQRLHSLLGSAPHSALRDQHGRRHVDEAVELGQGLGLHPGVRRPRALRDDGEVQHEGHQHVRQRQFGPHGESVGLGGRGAPLQFGRPRAGGQLHRLLPGRRQAVLAERRRRQDGEDLGLPNQGLREHLGWACQQRVQRGVPPPPAHCAVGQRRRHGAHLALGDLPRRDHVELRDGAGLELGVHPRRQQGGHRLRRR